MTGAHTPPTATIVELCPRRGPIPVGQSEDQMWRLLRGTVRDRLRELRTTDQQYALLRFHARRSGYITEPDMTGDLASSHQHEIRALGLTATGDDKAALVRNFRKVLGNALDGSAPT